MIGNRPVPTSEKLFFLELTITKNINTLSCSLGLAYRKGNSLKFACCYNITGSVGKPANINHICVEGTIVTLGSAGREKYAVKPGLLGESIGLFYDRTNQIAIFTRALPVDSASELRTIGSDIKFSKSFKSLELFPVVLVKPLMQNLNIADSEDSSFSIYRT